MIHFDTAICKSSMKYCTCVSWDGMPTCTSRKRRESSVFHCVSFPIVVLLLLISLADGVRVSDPWPSESILESSSYAALTFTPFTPLRKLVDSPMLDPAGGSKSPFVKKAPSTFRFGGTKGQFVRMPIWTPTATYSFSNPTPRDPRQPPSSVFSFQFRTTHSNGLLLYLDDRGPRNFMELSVHQGSLRLRFKFGNARSEKITVGKKLDNRRWHSVSVEVTFPQVTLTVDSDSSVGTAKGVDASPMVARSFTFLGGIPYLYKLQDLTLPAVYFETPFHGSIRRYAVDGTYKLPLEKLEVIEEEGSDLCYTGLNPCQHNGTCFVLNNEPACDCTGTRFAGKFCESTYDESAATFKGAQWLAYDMSQMRISSFSDKITLAFKTQQSDGLLLHTGKSADYVTLAMKKGGISLVVNLGSGALEVMLHPVDGTFNDNKWHNLKVYRELKQVNLTVDQAHTTAEFTQDDYAQLTLDDVFYIGGSPSSVNLPGQAQANNFIGCLKEVTYRNNDGTFLELSRMANNRDPRMQVRGVVQFICDDDVGVYGPVTFITSDSYLRLKPWPDSESGLIKMEFKTSEPHGLLLFSMGRLNEDFIAVEMYDGVLYLLINLGSGTKKVPNFSSGTLNDGKWHQLSVKRNSRQLTFAVDNQSDTVIIKGSSTSLDLSNVLYLGGTDFDELARLRRFPRGVWTASLRYGFVGCIRNVYRDGVGINLQALANSQTSDQVVAPECNNSGKRTCASQPCKNSGTCKEGWNRFVCDCSETSFRGKTCELAVTTAGFNGSQTLQIPMTYTKRTQAEEINFRFMTPLSSGLLMTTTSKTTTDRLTVQLVKGGQVKLTVDLDCVEKNCTAPRQGPDSLFQGAGLNDNKWHTVKISRHGRRLYLTVDGKIRGSELKNTHKELQFDTIHMGMVTGQVPPRLKSSIPPPFAGMLQNLMFNNEPLIDKCFSRKLNCKYNSTWGNSKVISNAVTFKDKISYVSIATLDAYSSMTLYFNLRTTVSDGLILYNAGKNSDFIAVELVNGFVHYVYDLGNGAQIISTPDQSRIDDNEWHDVRIIRDASNTHTLTVDGRRVTRQGVEYRRNLDLQGPLYVGGVRQDIYFNGLPAKVASRSGFQGCLGTFDFNGVSPQLLGRDMLQSAGIITPGCSGPTLACTNSSCANGGVCLQQWDSYSCDCSMTTFIGKTCTRNVNTLAGSTAYRFGGEGMMVYEWPSSSLKSSRQDDLALGFTTRSRNCVITRISSTLGSNIRDYMQLEIEDSKLTLRFNIGNDEVFLQEPFPVSDGQYHAVQIHRKWMNATMRVDHLPERTVSPRGNARSRFAYAASSIPQAFRPTVDAWLRKREVKNTVFNSQSMIEIGGLLRDDETPGDSPSNKSPREKVVVRSFRGQMMGFYFNQVRVFSLALHGSPQVVIRGDVEHIGGPWSGDEAPSSTPPGGLPYPTTTMATTTTFSTSSTRASRSTVGNASNGDDCFGQSVCSGSSDSKTAKPPLENTSKIIDAIKTPSKVAATKSPRTTSTIGMIKDDKTYSNMDPTPVLDDYDDKPKIIDTSYTDTGKGGKLDSNSTGSQGNNSDGLMNNDNKFDTKLGGFGKIFNGTTAMIAGIVGAAVICIVVLLVAIYRYKHKDEHSYHVDERARNVNGGVMPNGTVNGKKGPIVRKKGGSVTVHGKTLSTRESDKEYYV